MSCSIEATGSRDLVTIKSPTRPPAVRAEPETAPANALGIRRIMFTVDDAVARLRRHGAELVGDVGQNRTSTGSASCVAPRGIIIGLAEQIG
jgi:hypothetical protein